MDGVCRRSNDIDFNLQTPLRSCVDDIERNVNVVTAAVFDVFLRSSFHAERRVIANPRRQSDIRDSRVFEPEYT